ncbi:MAG: hypothetical protein WEB03_04560 [Nitriliruptor sp.]|uniref:hypothetical protein n=1 Tax=Nitriliruptor sp. TaxID=2448056 RepID=UPI0034A03F8F
MKHLLQGRYLTVALASGVAATLAAGAFGLSGATASDPEPIHLDSVGLEHPVQPVPLQTASAGEPSTVSPAEVSPISAPTPVSAPSPASVASPAAPAPAPAPAAPAPVDSYDSPDSPASVGSIDS